MVRKLLAGVSLTAALLVAVGCSSSSSAPQGKTPEQMKADQEKMKSMMPGGGNAPPSAK